MALLEERGVEAVARPLIRIHPPEDPAPLRRAARSLQEEPGSWDLILFTSPRSVEALARAGDHEERGGPIDPKKLPLVAAIGTATARAAREAGFPPAIVPDRFVAEAFLEELVERLGALAGLQVLFPRAAQAREVLPEGLRERGARVEVVEAYRTLPDREAAQRLVSEVDEERIQVVVFTSASAVEAFLEAAGPGWSPSEGLAVAAIGPVTADRAREGGLRVEVVPEEHTGEALAHAVARWWKGRS